MQPYRLRSLSVFFPAYNEEKHIPLLVRDCLKVLPHIAETFEIIIVDDGSSDGTPEVADSLAAKYPEVKVVHHPKNLGYGATLQSGYKTASLAWIFFTDGDRQFKVKQLLEFVPLTKQYNVVIGYRKKRADGRLRSLNARLFKVFIDLLFRVHVRDIDCAFKLIKSSVVKPLPLISTGAMISAELLYRLKKKGEPFAQLPVNHYPRAFGKPTGNNFKVVIKAGVEALRLYWLMKVGTSASRPEEAARATSRG